MANYDGENVARAGAIFVNFNYRVGALGFMAHPELSAEQGGHSGNYGTMDQTAALKWVRANIARFGGDPEQVLIVGQSAGAVSVASQIFQVGAKVEGIRIGGPIIDGYVLPDRRDALLARGEVARVPIIASYNADDIDQGINPIAQARTVADWHRIAGQLYGQDAPAFLALFPARSDAAVPALARQVASMAGLEQAARQCAVAQAAQGQQAWLALFARKHPYVPGVVIADQDTATIGAYHTADVPYWLDTLDAYNARRPTRGWTAYDRDLSARMLGGLIAMARTGSPETAALKWPAWSPRAERKLVLGDTVTVQPLDGRRLQWLSDHPFTVSQPRTVRPRD